MKDLLLRKLLFSILMIVVIIPVVNGSGSEIRYSTDTYSIGLSGKSFIRQKTVSTREPRSVSKARRKQESKEKKLKKEYKHFVKNNQKRSMDIQTPAVRERMKQNVRDADANYRAKRKASVARTKRGAKKYGR